MFIGTTIIMIAGFGVQIVFIQATIRHYPNHLNHNSMQTPIQQAIEQLKQKRDTWAQLSATGAQTRADAYDSAMTLIKALLPAEQHLLEETWDAGGEAYSASHITKEPFGWNGSIEAERKERYFSQFNQPK
jgi:hypothetical protein